MIEYDKNKTVEENIIECNKRLITLEELYNWIDNNWDLWFLQITTPLRVIDSRAIYDYNNREIVVDSFNDANLGYDEDVKYFNNKKTELDTLKNTLINLGLSTQSKEIDNLKNHINSFMLEYDKIVYPKLNDIKNNALTKIGDMGGYMDAVKPVLEIDSKSFELYIKYKTYPLIKNILLY